MHTQSNVTNIILKLRFLTIRILSKLPQSPGNGISANLNLKISSGLRPSFPAPNKKELPTALHASVICLCANYVYFFWKLHLHFPDSKHLRGFVCHEIFGNFLRHSEILAYTPPTIHASYGAGDSLIGYS